MPARYIRSARLAAQRAAIRISECIKSDARSSDSDDITPPIDSIDSADSIDSIDDSLARARSKGYDNTIHVVKYLLDECNISKNLEERLDLATKIFETINKNPKILIYEPKFRLVVANKMKEADELIRIRKNTFHKASYDNTLKMMKMSMYTNITNSVMRRKIYEHISAINITLNEYTTWMNNSPLKKNIDSLNSTLESIKADPEYISGNI